MTDTAPRTKPGKGPLFYLGLMAGAYAVVAALAITDAIEGPAIYALIIAPFALVIPMIEAANRRADATGGCMGTGQAQRRYKRRLAIFALIYLVMIGVMSFTLRTYDPTPTIRTLVALGPALAVVGMLWAVGRLIVEEQDEFLRMLVIRQSLIATGLTLCAATVWGFLENADVVTHLEAFWWPVVWFFGIGIGAIANRVRYGTWGAA